MYGRIISKIQDVSGGESGYVQQLDSGY